jgi:hypothetical protein
MRPSRVRGGVLLLSACAAIGSFGRGARADEKEACLSAYDQAQRLRSESKLTAAREKLAICSRQECPPLARQDCSQWMGEVMNALPSVVFGARDAQGHDVLLVRVSVDGKLVTSQLDGKPIVLDPGVHTFHYEWDGGPPVDQKDVLIREGEKDRAMTVHLGGTAGGAQVGGGAGGGEGTGHGPPALGFVLVGVGVVALGAALFLDLKGTSDAHALRDSGCAPSCAQSDVDSINQKYLLAGISAGVGVVAIAAATYVFLTSGGSNSPKTAGRLDLDVRPAPGGGSFVVGGRF